MRMDKNSTYGSTTSLDAALKRLEQDGQILDQNKVLIVKFVDTWLAKGYTKTRGVKLVYALRKLACNRFKPFDQAAKDDLITLVGAVEKMPLADNTKYDLKVVLKTFFRWLKGDDGQTPKEVSWLRPSVKNRSHKLPEEMITEDEVLRMAQAATSPRDKALVLVLFETGCRIGELLSLHVKNVSFDQYGAILRVTGKTGDRRVRIISSAPALATWLEHYEGASIPDAVLWPPRSNNNHAIDYSTAHRSAYKLLQTLAKKAGVTKHIYPHLFRHSRATLLAGKLTEAQMKEYFGWTQSSGMASVYVHLSGRDVDNALLELQGLAKREDKQEEKMKVVFCKRCHEQNSPSTKFCRRCGSPLADSAFNDYGEKANELMNALFQDPEVKEFIARKVIERGLIDRI